MSKIRVGVLFGGRSGEHEVSLASAASVLAALDPEKYEPVPIGITREGRWLLSERPEQLLQAEVRRELPGTMEAMPDIIHGDIVRVGPDGMIRRPDEPIDVVFPVLHGPYGEDGTVQGLLETANIPYVGAGVAASALSMDKVFMKVMLESAGLPGIRYCLVRAVEWERDPNETLERIEGTLGYPVFVKPSNLGSSVGISKVSNRPDLRTAIELAAQYDRRVIVEEGVDAREVECAVLGNDTPLVSVPGEVISHHEFYDYEAKYTEGLAELIIPARLSAEQSTRVRDLAARAFLAVDAAGLARVDFFIRRSDGAVLINEINTMPGFTRTSMYPKLWEASGLPYAELLDRLIELGLQRHAEKEGRSVAR